MSYVRACVACVAVSVALAGCEREMRPFQDLSAASTRTQKPVLSPLSPGGEPPPQSAEGPFQQNAWGMAEGKRLFVEIKAGPEILPELKKIFSASGRDPKQIVLIGFDFETMRRATDVKSGKSDSQP